MKQIPGYDGYYATEDGNVFSTKRGAPHRLRPSITNSGYYQVIFTPQPRTNKIHTIHRLVAATFIPNPNNLPCVNHRDGNKLNNVVGNLEWCSYTQNNNHALDAGLRVNAKGEDAGNSKLTEEDVLFIRGYPRYRGYQKALAEMFGLTGSAVAHIVSGRTWKHI